MKQKILVGIDIGTTTTRVVVIDSTPTESGVLRILGIGTSETHGMKHGYIMSRDEATASLKKAIMNAERESGQRIRSATVSIGGIGLESVYGNGNTVVTRADSIIGKFDIEKAIEDAEKTLDLKNKTILHAFPMIFKVDGHELPTRPEGIKGLKLEAKVLFITVLEQHLEDLLSVVDEAGVKVIGYTATPIAAESLLLTTLQRNFGCILIDIGAETTSVAVFENNTFISLHVFGIGSLDITKDIALGMRITPEEAESVKLGMVSFQSVSKKRLDDIIEARLSDIFELIDKYLKKIGRSGLLPAGAIIIGGGARLPATESVAKTILKIPVRIGHIDIPSAKGTLKDNTLLVAYGTTQTTKEQSTTKSPTHHDSEGFGATIKNFFKQLMP